MNRAKSLDSGKALRTILLRSTGIPWSIGMKTDSEGNQADTKKKINIVRVGETLRKPEYLTSICSARGLQVSGPAKKSQTFLFGSSPNINEIGRFSMLKSFME